MKEVYIEDYSFNHNSLYRDGDAFYAPKLGITNDMMEIRQEYPISEWNSPERFAEAGIRGYEPMTAKELDTAEKQDEAFNNPDNFIEEKFDGTRGILQFFENGARVFSRRISKKTGFYVENSDSVPQLKMTAVPELAGTVIDGEMFINGLPFKEVSSTLNCLWDKAIERQNEKGFITFHAFDILKYKGVDLRRMPLYERKEYLAEVVEKAKNPFIDWVKCYSCGDKFNEEFGGVIINSPEEYYEAIVMNGGEGVIIKPKNGQYKHKRGWEYSKIKKFLTRELILMGFDEPTKEYTGKFPEDRWEYWLSNTGARVVDRRIKDYSAKELIADGYVPVTRHYHKKQVGNLLLGVLIQKEEYEKIPKNKRGKSVKPSEVIDVSDDMDSGYVIMEVCECGGFDDETREYFTDNREELAGSVVEVRANELMKDSGRMRHPRYERMRYDKNPEQCVWNDHIA